MSDSVNVSNEQKGIDIVGAACLPDKAESIASLFALEAKMKEFPQLDIPIDHHFHAGMYARELTIKAGTLLTGRIHKFDHFDIMLSGDITVSTDDGQVKRLTGLNIMQGKAGKKRAGYAHSDTHWITFHSTDERHEDEMLDYLTCETFEELEDFNVAVNRADYLLMVDSIGMTEDEISKQVTNEADMMAMPDEYNMAFVGESKIHGKGYFADQLITGGSLIAPARIGDFRTEAGRYTNHALNPNAAMVVCGSGVNLMALKDIEPGEEITANYRDVINHRSEHGDLCQAQQRRLLVPQ